MAVTEEYKHYEKEIKSELFRKTLNRLSRKYKNKKVLFYGVGVYFDVINDNYNLSENFDVVGVSDMKYETGTIGKYKKFKVFKPSEIEKLEIEVILVTAVNFPVIQKALSVHKGIDIEHFSPTLEDKKKLIQINYKNVLKRSKGKNKLKVAFLISETAKWQYQSLYEEMEKDELFEPVVLVTPLFAVHKGIDNTRETLEDMYNFFKANNINVEYAYNEIKHEYLDLKQFKPDIIFYQQPWEIYSTQNISETSEFALTYYIPYVISESSFVFEDTLFFCECLYKHFVVDESAKKQYLEFCSSFKNIEVVGHPKLDAIKDVIKKYIKQNNKKTIIYAPHHSFGESGLRWATFKWSAKKVLKLAKENPEFNWIMKPHPKMKFTLLENNIMSQKEIEKYYAEWQKIGKVVEGGNYFELFAESDLMITDCGSFLVEYLLTKNPLIHLKREGSQKQSILNQKISTCYYCAKNANELTSEFENLMLKNCDPLSDARKSMLKELNFKNATTNIIKLLKSPL